MQATKRPRPAHHSGMRMQLALAAADILLGESPEACLERMEPAFSKFQTESSAAQHVEQKQLQNYLEDNLSVKKYVTTREFLKGEYGWKHMHQALRCYPLGGFDDDLLAARVAIPKEICCQLFCDLIQGWTVGNDEKGELLLGRKLIKGGFANTYAAVNVVPDPKFEDQQSHVIFAAGNVASRTMQTHNHNFKAFIGAVNLELSKQGFSLDWDSATDPGLEPIQLVETHFLFGFSKLTHFLYHRDRIFRSGILKGTYLSVIINLTPCNSSFEVAGATKPFDFDGVGSGAVFPSCLWHRSGSAQNGTVKVALFYLKKEKAAASTSVKEDDDKTVSDSDREFGSGNDSDGSTIPEVRKAKTEVNTEVKKESVKKAGGKERMEPRGSHP